MRSPTNLQPGAPIRMPSLEELRRKYDEDEARQPSARNASRVDALVESTLRRMEMEDNRAALPKPPWYAWPVTHV